MDEFKELISVNIDANALLKLGFQNEDELNESFVFYIISKKIKSVFVLNNKIIGEDMPYVLLGKIIIDLSNRYIMFGAPVFSCLSENYYAELSCIKKKLKEIGIEWNE